MSVVSQRPSVVWRIENVSANGRPTVTLDARSVGCVGDLDDGPCGDQAGVGSALEAARVHHLEVQRVERVLGYDPLTVDAGGRRSDR